MTVLISAVGALLIYFLVRPRTSNISATSIGRKWCSWMLAIATMAFLPRVLASGFDIDRLAVWLINMILWGGVSFLLGVAWGKFTQKKRSAAAQGLNKLMLAASDGDVATVRAELAAGVSPNARSYDGSTALMYAAKNDKLEIVRVLLAAGVDLNSRSNDKSSALDIAEKLRNNLTIEELINAGAKRLDKT